MEAVTSESKNVFKSLRGLNTLDCEQQRQFKGLMDTYTRMSGMEGPLSTDQIEGARSICFNRKQVQVVFGESWNVELTNIR